MIKLWWLAIRPNTLLASIGPIVLGSSLASSEIAINYALFFFTLLCALCLQIAVNLANDLFDGLSGVDSSERLGPTRAVQSGHITAQSIQKGLALACVLAVISGGYLVSVGGWEIFILGICSLLGVFAYSAGPFPLASNAMGEVTVFLFFGLIAVLGSYYLQVGELSFIPFGFAVSSGLLSAAIMLVNNIRDIKTDNNAGKITLAVRLKDKKSRYLFCGIIISALAIHIALIWQTSHILWFTFVLCLLPSLWVMKLGLTLRGRDLNRLLIHVAKLGFIYNMSIALLWFFVI